MTNLDFNIEMKANAEHMSPSGKINKTLYLYNYKFVDMFFFGKSFEYLYTNNQFFIN